MNHFGEDFSALTRWGFCRVLLQLLFTMNSFPGLFPCTILPPLFRALIRWGFSVSNFKEASQALLLGLFRFTVLPEFFLCDVSQRLPKALLSQGVFRTLLILLGLFRALFRQGFFSALLRGFVRTLFCIGFCVRSSRGILVHFLAVSFGVPFRRGFLRALFFAGDFHFFFE